MPGTPSRSNEQVCNSILSNTVVIFGSPLAARRTFMPLQLEALEAECRAVMPSLGGLLGLAPHTSSRRMDFTSPRSAAHESMVLATASGSSMRVLVHIRCF